MKRIVLAALLLLGVSLNVGVNSVWAYNFGDYKSVTLTTKAWEALAKDDIEAVLAYTNKCLELYAEQAQKMQASLTDYVTGSNDTVFQQWALNDVATCLFIQGEAYRKANMKDEAREAYQKLITEYSYGQCWDTKGWFWKPAEAAKEKLAALESDSTVDFGDGSSEALTKKAWEALASNDVAGVEAFTNKCIEAFGEKAREMQNSLTGYPWESNEKIFSYWALNDVGTCLFIKGEAYLKAEQAENAKKVYQELIDKYSYAQCWDPQGWFWKPAEAAQQKLDEIESN